MNNHKYTIGPLVETRKTIFAKQTQTVERDLNLSNGKKSFVANSPSAKGHRYRDFIILFATTVEPDETVSGPAAKQEIKRYATHKHKQQSIDGVKDRRQASEVKREAK